MSTPNTLDMDDGFAYDGDGYVALAPECEEPFFDEEAIDSIFEEPSYYADYDAY